MLDITEEKPTHELRSGADTPADEAAGPGTGEGLAWPLGCTINGEAVEVEVDPHETIYDTLRERLRLTGTKGACLEGECGSCTILVDGRAVTSCLVLAPQVQGATITTIEGLALDGEPHPVQRHFAEAGAVQCGYCTPGLILATAALLERDPAPTRDAVREGLAGNLCRCTGYTKIVDAVLAASRELAPASKADGAAETREPGHGAASA